MSAGGATPFALLSMPNFGMIVLFFFETDTKMWVIRKRSCKVSNKVIQVKGPHTSRNVVPGAMV